MVYYFHSKPIASVFKLRLESCTTQWYFMWPHPSITSMSGLILIFSSCPRLKVHHNSNNLHSWNMKIFLLLLGLHGQDYYFVLKPISEVFNPLQGWRLCSGLNTSLDYDTNNNSEFPENLESLVLVTSLNANHKLVRVIYHSLHTAKLGNKPAKNSMKTESPSSENQLLPQKESNIKAGTERVTEQYWVAGTAQLEV